jgi:hypothetical protein
MEIFEWVLLLMFLFIFISISYLNICTVLLWVVSSSEVLFLLSRWAWNICWFCLQIVYAAFFSPIITQRALYINLLGCSCEVSDIFVRFWIFVANFNKSFQYRMSRRCVYRGWADIDTYTHTHTHTHRQTETDKTKLIFASWNFAKELKNKNKELIYYSGYIRAPKLVVSLAQFAITGE